MQTTRLVLGSLLASAPFASFAQAADPTPFPRYYVGAGLYSSTFQNLGYHYGLTTIPVQALVGYCGQPRWAVQVGAAYSGSSADYDDRAEVFDFGTNTSYTYANTGRATDRHLSVALLVRRTLTRQPAHRVQFDALGGFTYEHLSYRAQGLYTTTYSPAPANSRYDNRDQHNDLLAGLGLGVRLRVARPLEVVYDFQLNTPLTPRRSGSAVTSATALGVRYHFGGLR